MIRDWKVAIYRTPVYHTGKWEIHSRPDHFQVFIIVFWLSLLFQLLLGTDNIKNAKLLTSAQKCEAFNRAYQAGVPKSVTFSCNCHGRIQCQTLKLNNGPAEATALWLQAVGATVSQCSFVIKHLFKMDITDRRRKSRSYILHAKTSRFARRMRNYKMYSKLHYSKGVSDIKPKFSHIASLNDHNYVYNTV